MDPDCYFCQSNLTLTLWTKFHILTQHKEQSHVHAEIRWFVSYYWPAHRKNDFLLKCWRILLTYLVCLLKVFSSNYNYSVGKSTKVRVRVQMPVCPIFFVLDYLVHPLRRAMEYVCAHVECILWVCLGPHRSCVSLIACLYEPEREMEGCLTLVNCKMRMHSIGAIQKYKHRNRN